MRPQFVKLSFLERAFQRKASPLKRICMILFLSIKASIFIKTIIRSDLKQEKYKTHQKLPSMMLRSQPSHGWMNYKLAISAVNKLFDRN